MADILTVNHLKKYFAVNGSVLKAVDDVTFSIAPQKTFSLVGESGCGKTTCGRTIMGLYEPNRGEICFDGQNVSLMNKAQRRQFHKEAQMIFQDPYSCLDPRMNVEALLSEGRKIYYRESSSERKDVLKELLRQVNLPESFLSRFPHELSGGQRQRIGIARALALDPSFLLCDEPIAALDVSIQAQVINILMKLQEERNLTYLFISHDLAVVRHISDEIGVMYLGSLVEKGPADEIFAHPLHPYTKALFSAVNHIAGSEDRIRLKGDLPSPMNIPSGCRFCTRCPYAASCTKKDEPQALKEYAPGHLAACGMIG